MTTPTDPSLCRTVGGRVTYRKEQTMFGIALRLIGLGVIVALGVLVLVFPV